MPEQRTPEQLRQRAIHYASASFGLLVIAAALAMMNLHGHTKPVLRSLEKIINNPIHPPSLDDQADIVRAITALILAGISAYTIERAIKLQTAARTARIQAQQVDTSNAHEAQSDRVLIPPANTGHQTANRRQNQNC
jgi:hypothetical protein